MAAGAVTTAPYMALVYLLMVIGSEIYTKFGTLVFAIYATIISVYPIYMAIESCKNEAVKIKIKEEEKAKRKTIEKQSITVIFENSKAAELASKEMLPIEVLAKIKRTGEKVHNYRSLSVDDITNYLKN